MPSLMTPLPHPLRVAQPGSFRVLGLRLLLGLLVASPLLGAEYHDHAAQTAQLQKLAAQHPELVRLTEQALTSGRREVWLLDAGLGTDAERRQRPALLVVAGIEGNDLVGSASVVAWVESLASRHVNEPEIHALLERTTIYVFPRLNPDAAESYFTRPRVERLTNRTPTDDDHDGLIDEDGPEDLNGDGLITSMRVEDPAGEFILDKLDPRLLLKADPAKGEKGAWKLLSEGVDNDKDDQWNEDDLGGVNLNRNFSYNYSFFAPNSGWHQVSEPETRALADFVVAHPNIALAFTFGAADNLVQPPKSEPGGKQPPAAISDADAPYLREIGQLYRNALGLKKELTAAAEPGTFSDWVYFHRGRLSLAAKPWTPQLELEVRKSREDEPGKTPTPPAAPNKDAEKPNSPAKAENTKEDKKPPSDKAGEEQRAILKWFDEKAPEGFVAWHQITHPDFPNQKVEVGGWAPFAQSNPPPKLLGDWTQRHGKFLTDLAGKLPRIGIRKAEAKHLGSGVFELTVQVENTGYLPTALAQGALTREVLRTRVILKREDKQILAGEKTTFLGALPGSGGMEELRYIVRGAGPLEVEVISALGGSARQTIELKEAP